jgi:hypothetical protein
MLRGERFIDKSKREPIRINVPDSRRPSADN